MSSTVMPEPLALGRPDNERQLRAQVREFLAATPYERVVDPMIAGVDPAFSAALGAAGWLGMTIPIEYGGQGRTALERYVVIEELLAAGAPIAAHWTADRQVAPSLLAYGNETLKRRFLPAIAAGSCFIAIGLSEPDAGSDLLSATAYSAAALPLAETTWIAGRLLCDLGVEAPTRARTVAILDAPARDGRISGVCERVPFVRDCDELLVVAGTELYRLSAEEVEITPGANLAGEPRDRVAFDGVAAELLAAESIDAGSVRFAGALARAVQLAGAARRVVEMSVAYTGNRAQFGRPLSKFQAIQQMLAEMASEAFVMDVAARNAVAAIGTDRQDLEVAFAKCNNSEAAGRVARTAHQVHGAMGVTTEYPLHGYTSRLWSWSREFGTSAEWANWIADRAEGRDDWELLTGVEMLTVRES